MCVDIVKTTVNRHKVSEKTLALLFASAARAKVLRVFMVDPHRAYYQRQLETATGLPIRAVQRELERLEKIELVYRWTEGNRTYYQIVPEHGLFTDLRGMVLKTLDALDAFRATLATDEGVRLAFRNGAGDRALVVVRPGARASLADSPAGLGVEILTSEAFVQALAENQALLKPYLEQGADLLGRRDDVIWRRIAAAGFNVSKGEGVP